MKTRKSSITQSTQVRLPAQGRERGSPVYFVTLHPTGELEIRPKGTRNPDAVVTVTVDGLYQGALIRKARAQSARRKPIKRGLLHLERKREEL